MPPKRTKKNKKEVMTSFTLEQAINYINSLANADNSKTVWNNALITLTHYNEDGAEVAPYTTMKKSELFDKFQNVNILPLILDSEKVVNIVENEIISTRSGQPIQLETKKSYYVALIRLTQKGSPCQIPKETRDIYNDKLKETGKQSNDNRNLNEPKRGNLEHPDFKWLDAVEEYNKFVTENSFTNTAKGRQELRTACLVGLYILQRPRRIQDYANLQYFSKKPAERDLKDRNIIFGQDGKLFFSIDKFKTRWRVAGANDEKKEVLPRYEKEVNPRLASLFKDYIKKAEVKDMSKLSTAERREGKNFYVFTKENNEVYDDNSFSKVMTSSFKKVFKKAKLSVNTFRHIFNTYISENIQLFNDKQLKEIAVDVGDTPKDLPTNMRYRISDQNMKDLDKTEIEGIIEGKEYARNLMIAEQEEAGSVGEIEKNDEGEEIASPPPQQETKKKGDADEDLEVLYLKLGQAHMQIKLLEMLISKKLAL